MTVEAGIKGGISRGALGGRGVISAPVARGGFEGIRGLQAVNVSTLRSGGFHNPDGNRALFSGTRPLSELSSKPSLDIHVPGAVKHAFDSKRTAVLWQAPRGTQPATNVEQKREATPDAPRFGVRINLARPQQKGLLDFSPLRSKAKKFAIFDSKKFGPEPNQEANRAMAPAASLKAEPAKTVDARTPQVSAFHTVRERVAQIVDSITAAVTTPAVSVRTEELPEPVASPTPLIEQQQHIYTSIVVKTGAPPHVQAAAIKAGLSAELVGTLKVATGTPAITAHNQAVESLKRAFERIGIAPFVTIEETLANTSSETNPISFALDEKANKARKDKIVNVYKKVKDEIKDDPEKKVTGKQIAQKLPGPPQPEELTSEVLRTTSSSKYPIDGSYSKIVEDVAKIEKIESDQEAIALAEGVVVKLPAVKVGAGNGEKVKDEDVKRVLTPTLPQVKKAA